MEEDTLSDITDVPLTDPTDSSSMETPVPVGIYLEDSPKLAQWGCYTASAEPPILGFLANTSHPDLALRFLTYLTEQPVP